MTVVCCPGGFAGEATAPDVESAISKEIRAKTSTRLLTFAKEEEEEGQQSFSGE